MINPLYETAAIKKYIIYEDEAIVALNKPEGMLSIPDGYQEVLPNLRDHLKEIYGSIWVIHRLDKLTSGIILFAKNRSIHKNLCMQFQTRIIKKKYAALVHGFPIWEEKIIDLPIRVNGDRQHRTIVDIKSGKKAVTKVKVIYKNNTLSYVQIFPNSGYSHQIRCHLAALGHPIIGDNLYNYLRSRDPSFDISNSRMFLHAESITFYIAPNTVLTITAPVPNSFNLSTANNGIL